MTDTDKRQYIDTQYYATTNTRFELDYELATKITDVNIRHYLFSGYGYDPDGGSNKNMEFGVWLKQLASGTNVFAVASGKASADKAPGPASSAYAGKVGDNRTVALDYKIGKFQVIQGSSTNYDQSITCTPDMLFTNNTIKVGSKYNGNAQWASIKVHGFRIFESGVKVRDFVPHWRKGKAGFVDQVTGIFVTYPGSNGHLETEGYIYQADDPYIDARRA